MAHPQGGSSSTLSRSNWNLEMLVFEERGKPEYPVKTLSEQGREPTTNLTHTDAEFGTRTRPTLVGGECSHHCTNPAPLIDQQRPKRVDITLAVFCNDMLDV